MNNMKVQDINIRDPYVFVEDGVAYMIGTTHYSAWGGSVDGFCGYKSRDLVNFEGPFVLFEANDSFWGNKDFWAPELHKYNGKYYLFATFKSNDKRRASQVLVCDEPFGRYVPLDAPITPAEWECLDATLYVENGVPYTVYCHEWLQCADGEMILAELKDDFSGYKGEPELLFKASTAPWISKFEGDNYITDGPFIKKMSNGNLVMLWSSFSPTGYALSMAVSKNGIHGPWEHIEKPLFAENGGHGMMFEFNGQNYIALHCPNNPDGAERAHFFPVRENGEALELC